MPASRSCFRMAIPTLVLSIVLTLTGAARAAGPTIVVDVKSGQVLEHNDAFQRWYPASLTKLMTAYVVFRQAEQGKLSLLSPVTISANATKAPPSKMYFKAGTRLTLDNALKIILVKSANDVSVAIAEAVAGDYQRFIDMMNAEAARLGMADTKFVNPHGLPGKGQSTTAYDMALLGVALHREFPQYRYYFALEAITAGKKTYTNYNALIGRFQGADGMKTGFICSSGFNQVSSATRDGKTVVSVVLGAKDQRERAVESARLLQKGLTSPGIGTPKLEALRPYGENREQIVDLRPSICSPAARKARQGGRDAQGRLLLESAFIEPPKQPAKAVAIALMSRVLVPKGPIPIPKSRPDVQSLVSSVQSTGADGTSAGVPIPKPRPNL